MSDSQIESHKPTPITAKRVPPVIVWLLILVIAAGAFAAVVMWMGGIGAVEEMLGLGGGTSNAQPARKPAAAPASTAATSAAETTATAAESSPVPVLPADAQERMYAEQLASQYSIKSLAQGDVASFKLGTPAVQGDTADVPLTAIWKSGARRSGVMTFRSYQGLWYFYQLSVAGDQDEKTPEATSIDPDVVRVYTEQQATPANQELISHGIIGGGQSVAEVKGVTTGSGTATVNLAMSGGSEAPAAGKIVLLKKKEGSETYWFIARFEKR